jgi:hypothetical protein
VILKRLLRILAVLYLTAASVAFSVARAAPIPITVHILDAPGQGFNDPTLGPARQSAFRYAADLWGSFFETTFPGQIVDIGVQFNATIADNFVAHSSALFGRPSRTVNYQTTITHAENLFRRDFSGTRRHGTVTFNPNVDFFLGTSGTPGPNQIDLVTFGLHELGHIFGFTSALSADGTYTKAANLPTFYDRGVTDASCNQLIDMLPEQRIALATSGNGLFWCASNAYAANGDAPFNLSASPNFNPDVNVLHISDTFFPVEVLMDPNKMFGEVIHTLHAVERGIFTDLQWTLAPPRDESVPEPSGLLLLLAGLAAVLYVRRAAFSSQRRASSPSPSFTPAHTRSLPLHDRARHRARA